MDKLLATIYSLSFEKIGGNWGLRKLHGFRISNNKLGVNLPMVY